MNACLRITIEAARSVFVDGSEQRRSEIGRELPWMAMVADGHGRGWHREELPGSGDTSRLGDHDVEDLAVLIDRPVNIPPDAGDLYFRSRRRTSGDRSDAWTDALLRRALA